MVYNIGIGNIIDPFSELTEDYMSKLKLNLVNSSYNVLATVSVTYTAMHGVGYPFVVKAFETANLKELIPVTEQITPDPEFSTVVFPNPEEGKSALNLAIKTADENGSQVILANDPDADRLAIAEKTSDGQWKVFSGNEIGALLCWWIVYSFKMRSPAASYKNLYTMSSTVSSHIARTIALREGLSFEETLTGFKWMGNRAHQLRSSGKQVIFAFEEAIGFMCRDTVLDKDGVSAAAHAGELIAFLYTRRETLNSRLNRIYEEYGHHITKNSYYICHDPVTIKSIFNRINHFHNGEDNTYPTSILNGKYNVVAVRDLHTGYDSTKPDHKAVLPISKSSFMVTFAFDNGLIATLRTSGTEPKLKYYTELCASPELPDVDSITATLDEMVAAIVDEFLEPQKNGLIPRSD
uniref:Phosphoglucomutase-2 n=2 Tax=Lygus hesperus TaxID=30085 RepID=A0A0K8SUW0_LYGHE